MSRDVAGSKKKSMIEAPIQVVPLPGQGSRFGLNSGYGRRKNQKKTAIPKAILRHLKVVFDMGLTGTKRSPAQTYQDLIDGPMGRDWRCRVLVNEGAIKEKFSSWSSKRKQLNRQAASSSSSNRPQNDDQAAEQVANEIWRSEQQSPPEGIIQAILSEQDSTM